MLNRYSSRRQPLDAGFLNARLASARSYDRIAGYFSSSILEVAGEASGERDRADPRRVQFGADAGGRGRCQGCAGGLCAASGVTSATRTDWAIPSKPRFSPALRVAALRQDRDSRAAG